MKIWKCGRFDLPLGRKTYVMGILNATPDSFSGDGTLENHRHDATIAAIAQAERMVEDGADILDIGGESTRPGATPVSIEEELRRVLPLVESLAPRLNVPISVDTTKSEVARACLDAGASIVNDISGGTFDARLLPAIVDSGCGVILMHLRGTPQTMEASAAFQDTPDDLEPVALDLIAEIKHFWSERIDVATAAGIADERIALDAGFGFGKSLDENLETLRRGRELSDFGFPTLSATSRKSTLGRVLAQARLGQRNNAESSNVPSDERQWATASSVALAIAGGCDIVRVHDVREMAQVAALADAVTRVP